MSGMADQLRETYRNKETDELVELAGRTTLTDTAYAILDEILISRGVNIDSVKALRAQNAAVDKSDEKELARLASIPRRFAAKLIDSWGILLVIALLASILKGISPEMASTAYGILTIPWLVYFLFKDGLGGQSVGKRMMKIRVVHHATKRPCSFGQSFWRNLPSIFVFDWLFALGKRQMRLGDMIANTEVVNSK